MRAQETEAAADLCTTRGPHSFFFSSRRRHTRYIGDWSSDECSSDLPVGLSSDGMQISTMSPWINLYYVVTGKNARGQVINGNQTLLRNEALRLYTANNGWFLNAEDKLGTIEEGKLADLVVLSADYFSVKEESIKDIYSVLTVVNGTVVHDDLDGKSKAYWKAGLPAQP